MKKKNPNQLPIIPIGLSVCFLGIITFLFLHFSTQNENNRGIQTPPVEASPNPGDTPENGDEDKTPDAYRVIFQMTQEDISRGSLVLVDKENRYNLKETDLDLVLVNNAKTVPFQIRPGYANITKLCSTVIAPLDLMMQAYIDEAGENTAYIFIGYRDEADQQKTLDDFTAMLGREAALQRVALPGHSEHHAGLAMDLGALVDGVHHTFDYRESNYHAPTKWFALNSYRFGFVLSFPEDRAVEGESIYEPWHYRYVGYPHSQIMFENDWSLKEYLDEIRRHTLNRPFTFEYDNVKYEIFYTNDMEVKVFNEIDSLTGLPLQNEYDISGNNIDGFIVTIKK